MKNTLFITNSKAGFPNQNTAILAINTAHGSTGLNLHPKGISSSTKNRFGRIGAGPKPAKANVSKKLEKEISK